MTVESNYVIAIATLSDWLKRVAPVFQLMRSKTKTNRTMYAWFFPRFRAGYRSLLGIVIGSWRCSFLVWLVGVIALVLVFDSHLKTALSGQWSDYRQHKDILVLRERKKKGCSLGEWTFWIHFYISHQTWENIGYSWRLKCLQQCSKQWEKQTIPRLAVFCLPFVIVFHYIQMRIRKKSGH